MAVVAGERTSLHTQLLAEMMGDVGIFPLFWQVVPVPTLKGVRSQKMVGTNATWNFFVWDKE